MKIDFSQELKTLKGLTMKQKEGDQEVNVKLSHVAVEALMADLPEEKESGQQKAKRYKLCQKLVDAKEIDLEVEELALVKERIGKVCFTSIVGPAWEMLDKKEASA